MTLVNVWERPHGAPRSLASPPAPQKHPLQLQDPGVRFTGWLFGESILLGAGPRRELGCIMSSLAMCLPLTNAFWSSLPDGSTSAASLRRSKMKEGFVKPPQPNLSCGRTGSSSQPERKARLLPPDPEGAGAAEEMGDVKGRDGGIVARGRGCHGGGERSDAGSCRWEMGEGPDRTAHGGRVLGLAWSSPNTHGSPHPWAQT